MKVLVLNQNVNLLMLDVVTWRFKETRICAPAGRFVYTDFLKALGCSGFAFDVGCSVAQVLWLQITEVIVLVTNWVSLPPSAQSTLLCLCFNIAVCLVESSKMQGFGGVFIGCFLFKSN